LLLWFSIAALQSSNDTTRMPFGGARTKRVMAPGGQGLPARVTRQKTRSSASTHEDLPATDVALVPPRSPAQHEDPLLMDDEGMWLNFVLLFFICSPNS